ncbi:sulfotransferase domain-containing protein [Candidatus Saccharibacteria bacterium]|nr:sulfotransferase domain-containing protein [Candidatus Saccharibacteria bacterium]
MSSDAKPRRAPLFLRLVPSQLSAGGVKRLHPAPRTTFVLSTGRTGSVYLADLMNQLDDVVSLHEPKPSRILIAWTSAFLEGHVSRDYMSAVLANKRRKLLADVETGLYVESNNFISGFADSLEDVFDNPTVIHVVRDPRDFVTSQTNRGDSSGLRGFLNKYVPYLAYTPEGKKQRQLDALERGAYRWEAINKYLSDYGNRNPNRYHYFKFEEVFDKKNKSEMKRLLKACGLSTKQISELDFEDRSTQHAQSGFSILDKPQDSSNSSRVERMKKWREWSDEDAKRLQVVCGPLMKQYGYGNEPEWRKTIR